MASAEHPEGFTSVRSSFNWPKIFIDKLAKHFGDDWLAKRLSRWQWSVSTAFSGVGAPESVLTPAHLLLESKAVRYYMKSKQCASKHIIYVPLPSFIDL